MTEFKRAPHPETQKIESGSGPLFNQNILALIRSSEHDPSVNIRANVYEFATLYKERGVDLNSWYQQHTVTSTTKQEEITDKFFHNKKHSFAATLAETLPLFANVDGRLGPYIKARVTKTAKPDDQGNSFIDLVVEVENKWLAEKAPKELQDVPSKMSFLVDVTTSGEGEIFQKKQQALRDFYLLHGEKANVKCYKNKFGDLGIEKPKIIVAKQADYIEKVGASLGDCVTQLAYDSFSINKPDRFNTQYQAYFLDFITAIGDNARDNIEYLKRLVPGHLKRAALLKEYEKITAFVEAYKKTPITQE